MGSIRAAVWWPIVKHVERVTMPILVMFVENPISASACMVVCKLVEVAFFYYAWPYEEVHWDAENRGSFIQATLMILAFTCLTLDGILNAACEGASSTGLSVAFTLVALVAALTPKVRSRAPRRSSCPSGRFD